LTDVFKCIVTFEEKFSPIYRSWTANKPQVHLLQPEDVEVRSSRKISDFFLTFNLLPTTIVAPPSNASKWQMGFNSAFKGLMIETVYKTQSTNKTYRSVEFYFNP
jgi:hypothetical protein